MGENLFSALEDMPIPKGNYVLVLPGWYPTWLDPYPGDFNQRHVKAAGLYSTQLVLYVGKDTTGIIKKTEVRYSQFAQGVFEVRVIYPMKKLKAWDVVHSNLTYLRLFYQYTNSIKKLWGLPKLAHCYIVMRGGLGGWLLKKRWNLPYILTENWTIYYPEDPGYLLKRNPVFQHLVKKVFKKLDHFLPVTGHLQKTAEKLTHKVPFTIIPNVVETSVFQYHEKPKNPDRFCFVHVSTMTYQKNPEGLLRSFKKYYENNPLASLIMVGPYPAEVLQYARGLGLNADVVQFTGGKKYYEVAEIFASAHALVLFSRYENLPCVILEALCNGLPVISTIVGGITEVINETNGILIDNSNEEQLLQAFETMVKSYPNYNHRKISIDATSTFSYETVGHQINKVYAQVSNNW